MWQGEMGSEVLTESGAALRLDLTLQGSRIMLAVVQECSQEPTCLLWRHRLDVDKIPQHLEVRITGESGRKTHGKRHRAV